ncbi:MAG: bifunctional diaminohydroxyphosphoribosylaminopyrimidine deaminase/5-amino-6-(5-phosphoribosylamino)uracil reductase RibD [Pyrinomonadaceae bacterium]
MNNSLAEFDLSNVRRSLALARAGIGMVSPNPLVGCLIVSPGGQVIGEGSYKFDEVVHAEEIALRMAGESARGGTAYVSLEPHSHFGKTPPCTDALINAGIRRVVCPIEDPNPLVSGRGFARLREAGIEVVTGVCAEEAHRQNEKFICWHTKKRPFVHLKLAMSLDGRISIRDNVSTSLSGEQALKRVHDIRHEHDAILVGGNTVAVDDPTLTDRSGKARRRPLLRVILDNRLQTSLKSRIADTAAETPTLIFSASQDGQKRTELVARGIDVSPAETADLHAVLSELRKRDIQSVLVEGGSAVAGAFCDSWLVDKLTFIVAPMIIGGSDAVNAIAGSGVKELSDALYLDVVDVTKRGDDIEITAYPRS